MVATAIALVVDRSGSMQSMASDVKGGVKKFVADQKKMEGSARMTLAQFDHQYQVVHNFTDLKQVDENGFAKQYSPRGSTALLDAIGRTIINMQKQIDGMKKAERPERVVVAIVTDGYENASHKFSLQQIKSMVEAKEKMGWDFVFMGATMDTIDVAKQMGFCGSKTAVFSTGDFDTCFQSIGEKVTAARLNKEVAITDEERELLKNGPQQTVAAA